MKRKKRKKCDLNENENDVLDLPSLEIVSFEDSSFCHCHVAVFESMWWLFIFIFILDLPKLHTISFDGHEIIDEWCMIWKSPIQGGQYNRKTNINGHESYDNTLIMKSKLKWNEMWIVFW